MFFRILVSFLCGAVRIPYAAGGLEQQVVELLPQNYSVAKTLKTARLQGPVSGAKISRKPATLEGTSRVEGTWLRESSCAYPRTHFFQESQLHPRGTPVLQHRQENLVTLRRPTKKGQNYRRKLRRKIA